MLISKRKCIKCKEIKPATKEFFHKDKSRYLGLMYRCKECDKNKKDNRKNRYSKLTKEQKEAHYKLGIEYRKTDKGKAINRLAAYRKFDKLKGLEFNLTQEDLLNIEEKSCNYCGFPSTGYDRIDNKIGHVKSNIIPCCSECNVARNDNFSVEEMKIIGKTIRQIKLTRLKI